MSIKEKLNEINKNITKFSQVASIKMVAVTKYATDEQLLEASRAGVKIFGESYVLAALDRIERLASKLNKDIEWHLIGTLQKNKVNKAVGRFNLIQSVDSLELLEKIDLRSASLGIKQEILIQVNISGEITKSGFSPSDFSSSLDKILTYKNVKVKGLMAMNAQYSSDQTLDENFKIMRSLLNLLSSKRPDAEFDLSVGMSADYCASLKRGATMVRIGSALFG